MFVAASRWGRQRSKRLGQECGDVKVTVKIDEVMLNDIDLADVA